MTNEALAVLRNIPSLRHASTGLLIALVAIAAIFGFVLIFLLIFIITDVVSTEQKEHKLPDSHKVILDLQKTLVNEMRGTAKQNMIMIWLTVLFIAISVIGMVISVLGPDKAANLFNQAIDKASAGISRIFNAGKGATGR